MFNVLTMCSSKAELETGLCANVSFSPHAFWLLAVDITSQEISEVYIQSNRQEQVATRIPFFPAEAYKPSNSAPNTSCSLCASCTCVCVYVGLFKTNWPESYWKSFAGCVVGWAWNSRLTPKPLACRQVGIAIVFSLAWIRSGFSLSQSHMVVLLLLGTLSLFSCTQFLT